jgi:hypothetical protein
MHAEPARTRASHCRGRTARRRGGWVLGLAGLAGCTVHVPDAPIEIPPALRAPPDQVLFVQTYAHGTQVYDCEDRGTPAQASLEWVFRGPQATLTDRDGRVLGRHFDGPTWEWSDGSQVVGDVQARASAPQPGAIAWLLLRAKSHSHSGLLSQTLSIQRLDTRGGEPPPQPCTAGRRAEVPYTARYHFYRAAG